MNVAVITGAANGIGLALSQLYLQRGATVVMVDRNSAKLNEEARKLQSELSGQVLPYSYDVSNKDEVLELATKTTRELGRVDWIYNNAGIIGQLAPVWELDPEQAARVLNVNVLGMIHIIQAFIPFLFEQHFKSHIINMASLYSLCSSSQTAPYSMSKHAVLALSESLYFDLTQLDKPVDVSVVFPSFTDTGLLTNNSEDNSLFHEALHSLLTHSRPAMDVAEHIIKEVDLKKFYIFPDKEVKGYCEQRTQALVLQENPHYTNVEKLMSTLIKRQKSRICGG